MFGKLRVWDTEANNGVLIYLLLAEHAIEIVADRGVARVVPQDHWQQVLDGMRAAFRAGRFEEGLAQAIDAVDAELAEHAAAHRGHLGDDGSARFPAACARPGSGPPGRAARAPRPRSRRIRSSRARAPGVVAAASRARPRRTRASSAPPSAPGRRAWGRA
jgi:hypothetical protein